jgi:hypothetical protein
MYYSMCERAQYVLYTVKRIAIIPSPDGMSLTNLFLAGKDITAGYRKIASLFYSVELATYTRKRTDGAIGGLILSKMLCKSNSDGYDLK